MNTNTHKVTVGKVVQYLILILMFLLLVGPFVWELSLSFKGKGDNVYAVPPYLMPKTPTLENYISVFKQVPVFHYMLNTLVVCLISIFGNVVFSTMAGYALGRLKWRGRGLVFTMFMGTMVIPIEGVMISQFLIIRSIHLQNTLLAVALPGLCGAINILLINIFSALATGGAIVSSQYIGREEPHQACEAAKQLILSVFVLSTAIGALFVFGGPQILGFIYHDVESAVMQNAEIYFFLTALSYPFIALYNAGAALFRAMGNSRISMVISIVMNCINVGGNALFIFGFDMGAAGAALATLISRIVGAIFILILLHRSNNVIHIDSYLHLNFHPGMIKNILAIGIPNGLENGMFQLGKIIVQGTIASYGTALSATRLPASPSSPALPSDLR